MSRRCTGIRLKRGDLASRALGRAVAAKAWSRAAEYFEGKVASVSAAQQFATFPKFARSVPERRGF
jgi:hypothetical protein